MNKQSNEKFNNLIEYIEENLCEEIEYKKLSQILGVSEYTLHRIFLFVTNYNLADYIRRRRLSMSTLDLLAGKEKIIDIAIKYGYESSQSFSRAFRSMMGFVPSDILKNKNNLKFFPKYEIIYEDGIEEFSYQIERDIEFNLYAISMKTTIRDCHIMAPKLWKEEGEKLEGKVSYGLLEYDKMCKTQEAVYYIASKETFEGATSLKIPKSNYLTFDFEFISPEYFDQYCCKIYRTIIPSAGYELQDLPDIEEYLLDGRFRLYIPVKE